MQSIYAKQNKRWGTKLYKLSYKRKNKINNFLNQSVAYIIKHCLENKIGNLVIGELKGIKQNINIGRKNNQNFVNIPFGVFKQKLRYKCELKGIKYVETEESYTSQICCICGKRRKSNRTHRGRYRCDKCKKVFNADINGAVNIIKKVVPEFSGIWDSGLMNNPSRIRLFTTIGSIKQPS